MNQFTRRATRILSECAPKEAKRLGHRQVRHEHVMLGMINGENDSNLHELVVSSILSRYNVDTERLAQGLEEHLSCENLNLATESDCDLQSLQDRACAEAADLNDLVVGTEHILLALLRENAGKIASCLRQYSLTYDILREELSR